MSREILVQREDGKDFKITIPDDAKVTFAPWSPPTRNNYDYKATGTLRVYKTEKNVMACFSGVTGFRDVSLEYQEKVVVEEGATVWKNDKNEYTRETKVTREEQWEIDK